MTTTPTTTLAPILRSSVSAARIVPPVAIRSSTMIASRPEAGLSDRISKMSDPYSKSYSTEVVGGASLPFFLIGTKGAWSCCARSGPIRNPRESRPAITGGSGLEEGEEADEEEGEEEEEELVKCG